MVCFMESLADSEIPLEITELSSGSILLSIFAITRNPRSKFDFRVETKSSLETPPPLLRQLTVAEYEAERRPRLVGQRMTSWWWWWLRENGARWRWRGLNDASVLVLVLVVMRERVKARADAIYEFFLLSFGEALASLALWWCYVGVMMGWKNFFFFLIFPPTLFVSLSSPQPSIVVGFYEFEGFCSEKCRRDFSLLRIRHSSLQSKNEL